MTGFEYFTLQKQIDELKTELTNLKFDLACKDKKEQLEAKKGYMD